MNAFSFVGGSMLAGWWVVNHGGTAASTFLVCGLVFVTAGFLKSVRDAK